MKMRKSLAILLVFTMLFSIVPIGMVFAATGEEHFTFSAGTITGYNVATGGTNVVIPSTITVGEVAVPVTAIGQYAFYNKGLTSITIPTGVTSIGAYAFWINELTSITIPISVTLIDGNAFMSNQLTSITIPASVTLGNSLLANSNNIFRDAYSTGGAGTYTGTQEGSWNRTGDYPEEEGGNPFTFDAETRTITGYDVVLGGTEVEIPSTIGEDDVVAIGESAFEEKGLTSITIPTSVTSIGDYAFASNELTSITIPNSVTSIGFAAFRYNQLTSITIPTSVTSIGNKAFASNELTSITIPADVELGDEILVDNDDFRDAYNLISGIYTIQEGSWTRTGDYPYPPTADEHFTFNEGTGTITDYNVTSGGIVVVIPSTIGEDDVLAIGENAFLNKGLTSVTIPNSVTSIGTQAFSTNQLTSITIPDGVISIGNYALWNNQLTSITIPNSVTSISNYAFDTNQLTSLTIPTSVTSIGTQAFSTNQLESIEIPTSVTSIGDFAFFNNQLTSIPIPTSVTEIGEGVFNQNKLTDVTIPNWVTSIGAVAFGSNQITNLTIPNSVTSIGAWAFADNQLTSIPIPTSVTEIGEGVFYQNKLTDVTIPNWVTSIGAAAFGSNQITNLTIPNSVTSIGAWAFADNQLTSITIPANVTLGDEFSHGNNNFRDAYITGGAGVYTGPIEGAWTKVPSVNIAAIQGVSAPVRGATPVTTITGTAQYTGTVSWSPAHNSFGASTAYTATIAITPKAGHTLTGVSENFFTVAGTSAPATNATDAGVVIAVFPATAAVPSDSEDSSTSVPTPTTTPTPTPPPATQEPVVVIVNGKSENAGTETKTTEEGRSVVTVVMNNSVIEGKIEEAIKNNTTGANNLLQIPVADTTSNIVKVELTGDMIKKLEENIFALSIKRDNVEYSIPAQEFTISKVAKDLGIAEASLKDIKIDIIIEKLDQTVVDKYEAVAKANGAELIFPPMKFEITAKTTKADGTTEDVIISRFSNYVERVMEIPAGIDPSNITTGIVFNVDGTYSHVPTDVFQMNDKWYAKLNSLTNSNYSVISNPVIVKSVEKHWSKSVVNDMASRLIIFNPDSFMPDEAITRADFAEYIVRALGLYREGLSYEPKFEDVSETNSQMLGILIAGENGIVNGYADGTFKPDALITREEAMTMYQRAMLISKLEGTDATRFQSYSDFSQVSVWAVNHVKEVLAASVFNGTTATTISPKSNLTYAEAAQAIKNLLVESKLINK